MEFRKSAVENMVRRPDPGFWSGKKVLLTGHTGFKGGWLALWLDRLGADVVGVSLPPAGAPNLFDSADIGSVLDSRVCDIRDAVELRAIVETTRPEIVLHLAAQPLVRAAYADPLATFSTNVMGTANLLEAIRGVSEVRVATMVTTDKVYRNVEWAYPYREDDPLGGHDPYSASKAASEIVIASYRDAFLSASVAVASARAGNVIGGGDWSADRLIPDAVRAWQSGGALEVRRPAAMRPWQHVLEPLSAYLCLSETLWDSPKLAGAFNFGPETVDAADVRQVTIKAQNAFGKGQTIYGDGADGPHEAGLLALEIAKARAQLAIRPRWSLDTSIDRTMKWYSGFYSGGNARDLCVADIVDFESLA